MDSLYDRIDGICEQAARIFLEGEDHVLDPTLIFEIDGKIGICPLKMGNVNDKDVIAMVIETLIRDKGVREYVMVTEVWMANRESFSDIDMPVRDMPDKVEAIMIHYCSPMKNVLLFAKIHREGDSVTLGKWERKVDIKKGEPRMDTRFGNIFEKVLSANN